MFEPNCVICVVSPEVSLKSDKVRSRFNSILKKNIITSLKNNKIVFSKVFLKKSRYFIITNEIEKTIKVLKKCFGVFSLSPARVEKIPPKKASEKGLEISKKIIKNSFAVRCKNFSKEKKSKDFEIEAGSLILEKIKGTKVNLTNPEKQLNMIVFEEESYFYFESIKGVGGMPVSSQGRIAIIPKNNYSKELAFFLLKSGCTVFSIKKNIPIKEYNSYEKIKTITLQNAIDFEKNNSIIAFFTDALSLEEKKQVEEKIGKKVFAPFLFERPKKLF